MTNASPITNSVAHVCIGDIITCLHFVRLVLHKDNRMIRIDEVSSVTNCSFSISSAENAHTHGKRSNGILRSVILLSLLLYAIALLLSNGTNSLLFSKQGAAHRVHPNGHIPFTLDASLAGLTPH